jgi:hypothetical protein
MKIRKFNDYEIKGDFAEIFVVQRNGRKHIVSVDIDDFYKIRDFGRSVHVQYHRCAHSYYPHITIYEGKDENGKLRYKNIKLTTFLFGSEKGIKIDHIDSKDTLNTRRSNLRITNQKNNLKNRRSRNSNNKSGYRNVCWIDGYWRVQLQIDGKNHLFSEKFTDVEEAGKFAEQKRQEIYGEFAGNN